MIIMLIATIIRKVESCILRKVIPTFVRRRRFSPKKLHFDFKSN